MWEWLLNELKKAVRAIPMCSHGRVHIDRDDVIGNVSLYLCQNLELAKKIYDKKEIGLLYHIAKKEVYNMQSKLFFENKMEFSRYQRIIEACEKHKIEAIPENAYKISALLENGQSNFTISGIIVLLSTAQQKRMLGGNKLCANINWDDKL